MRGAVYLFCIFLVVLAAFWTYSVTYKTKDKLKEARQLRRAIAVEREAIAVLNAEWAYLNAPERLSLLVAEHQEQLLLAPMLPDHFAELEEVVEPHPDDGMDPVALIGLSDPGVAPEGDQAMVPRWVAAR
ncbi:MAG: cell division protein FtsL [Pseudomonadota bacterium]